MVTEADRLAALIREVDGNHSLGAGALAEELVARGVRITPLDVVEVERARQAGSV